MGVRERRKGAAGEREWAAWLSHKFGCPAHRGRQNRGGPDSPDVAGGLPGTHAEVKRVERLNLWAAYSQAADEAPSGSVPYVAHRRNREPWMVTMRADDLLDFAESLAAARGTPIFPAADEPPT